MLRMLWHRLTLRSWKRDPVAPLLVFYIELLGDHSGMLPFDQSYLNALNNEGLKVVWVADGKYSKTQPGSPTGTSVEVWTPFRGLYDKGFRLLRGLRYARGLWAVLRRAVGELSRHRVVIHQQFVVLPALDLLFVICARLLGLVCIISPHDITPYADRSGTNWVLPMLYRRYDAIIVHSKTAHDEIEKMPHVPGNLIWQIPLGHLNEQRGDQLSVDQVSARNALHIPTGVPVVLFMGQIKREKGLDVLLDAMPQVLSQCPDARLIVAGRPYHLDIAAYEKQIDALRIRDSVYLRWEYVPEQEMAYYFCACDVVALPYLRIYQSAVCLTAYSYRRPVIASATGGLTEQVLDGKTGYLVPPGNAQALAQAIVHLLSDMVRAQKMGQFGRDWIAHSEDWGMIARKSIELYHYVLDHKGRIQDDL
jgi:D-inositol-3-phosphate glycosyltransferase